MPTARNAALSSLLTIGKAASSALPDARLGAKNSPTVGVVKIYGLQG